jgi:leucyl/phenylalanyl-tRNA--protein transferase
MVFRLDKELWFPNPRLGEDDGLIAVGGDLSVDRLLLAYSHGFFPWYSYRMHKEPVWYCPMDRFVIFPDEIHISHSMRTLLNKGIYTVTFNKDFDSVIRGCSEANARNKEDGAWLGKDIIRAYTELNRQGFASSVEVWKEGELAGGLYGVCIGCCFFGESMFSLEPSTSKVALIHLASQLKQFNNTLIDCQFETPHLKSMGGRHITYDEYMDILNKSLDTQ